MNIRKFIIFFILFPLPFNKLFSQRAYPGIGTCGYSISKKSVGQKGAVVSAHPLASQAGLLMLKKGGNAIDAAIATQLALAVVYPGAGNLGGGGFMVARLRNGSILALDYREKAPGKAGRDMYLDEKGNPLPDKSRDGHLSAGVPGTVAGLFASMRYARLPFATLTAPAIAFAEKGFCITQKEADNLNRMRDKFLKNNSSSIPFVRDTPWKAGDTLVQPQLAATLKRIVQNGRNEFYTGTTAKLIIREMKNGNGILTAEDLATYQPAWRKPMTFKYKGHTVITMPLPSSGGLLLQQMMRMIEERNLNRYGFHSPAAVQLMVEAERRAYADRAEYLGDPDFVKVPVKQLTSPQYLKARMEDFDSTRAGNSNTTGPGQVHESEETTHISIIDVQGNAVSLTTTLNDSYGSKTMVSGAGFLLNDEMDDFSIKPGTPNMYGAVGNEKNAIAPGKRMLSSMTPVIVIKKNQPVIVAGSPGGTTIPTSVFQTLVNLIDFNLSPEEAVNQPKFHHQWLPDLIDVEKDFPQATREKLMQLGYTIRERMPIGRTEVIIKGAGGLTAVGDKRGDDAAAAY